MENNSGSEDIELVRRTLEKYEKLGGPCDQEELKKMLNLCSTMMKEVHSNGLFSTNEDFKEVSTEDIKYLLVPYYQAEILQKFMENRDSKLDLAMKFYDEFFKVLNNYGYFHKDKIKLYNLLRGKEDDESETDKDVIGKKPSLELMAQNRTEKILAYKYKQTLSERLKVIFLFLK